MHSKQLSSLVFIRLAQWVAGLQPTRRKLPTPLYQNKERSVHVNILTKEHLPAAKQGKKEQGRTPKLVTGGTQK